MAIFAKRVLAGGLLGAASLLVGCQEPVARIQIKGPRDAFESVRAQPKFAPFEKRGQTIKLRASAFNRSGVYMRPAKVRWSSSDGTVATVSPSGLVTILGSGSAAIVAETTDIEPQLRAELPIQVQIADKIRIVAPAAKDTPIVLALGETKPLRAEVLNDRGEVIPDAPVRWEATNHSATVYGGELEGRALGRVEVVAETRGGIRDRIAIEVKDWSKTSRRR